MRRVYVRVRPETVEQIVQLAERERRDPADQAALLIERALARYGQPRSGNTRKEVKEHVAV